MPGVRKAKTSPEIKTAAARRVVRARKEAPEDMEAAIKEVESNSSQVGHTWVKFSAYSGETMKEHYSFGFYPRTGYAHPQRALPGVVMHPDLAHENKKNGQQLFVNHEVEEKNYAKGLRRVQNVAEANPDYKLGGYNCTKFAQDVASAVGISFPSKATVFPAGPSKLFFQRIYNPNELYSSLARMQGSDSGLDITDQSRDKAQIEGITGIQVRHQLRRQNQAEITETQNLRAYLVTNSRAIFYRGEKPPGDEDWGRYFEYQVAPKVYMVDDTPREFTDPDNFNRSITVVKVRYIDSGVVRAGWIKPEDIEPAPVEKEPEKLEGEGASPETSAPESSTESSMDEKMPEQELMEENEDRGGLSESGTTLDLTPPPPPEEDDSEPEVSSAPSYAPPPTHVSPPLTETPMSQSSMSEAPKPKEPTGPIMGMGASAMFMEGATLKELWQQGLIDRDRYRELTSRERRMLNDLLEIATNPMPLDQQLEELFKEDEPEESTQPSSGMLLPEHMRFVL